MATTPNYGWVTPAPTDFVTDLPADFETFADAVDASFAADEGDLLVGGTSNIFEPLPIGAAGTVLTSDGDTATWLAPSAGGKSYTLLNSGNTSVGTGTSFTVSGISGIDDLMIIIDNVKGNNANQTLRMQFNADGSNHYYHGIENSNAATYNSSQFNFINQSNQGNFNIAKADSTSTGGTLVGAVRVFGCSSTNAKVFTSIGSGEATGAFNNRQYVLGGYYLGTSAITSVTISVNSNNLASGNLRIYGAA